MPSLLREYRLALQAHLETDLGLPMVSGRVEGPIETGPLACTYPIAVEEVPDRVMEAVILVGVRVLLVPPIEGEIAPENPGDPGELEDMAERIQQSVSKHQTQLGPWYQRVQRCDIDLDAWSVDATVIAYTDNLAV